MVCSAYEDCRPTAITHTPPAQSLLIDYGGRGVHRPRYGKVDGPADSNFESASESETKFESAWPPRAIASERLRRERGVRAPARTRLAALPKLNLHLNLNLR